MLCYYFCAFPWAWITDVFGAPAISFFCEVFVEIYCNKVLLFVLQNFLLCVSVKSKTI